MNHMRQATYGEWLASITGVCLTAAAIGMLVPKEINRIAPFILVLGVGLHVWGMVRIYSRNRGTN